MKIKNVNIDGNLFLAPMAGVTDFAFRSIAREYGASFSYTEMVSAKALVYDNKKTKDLLITLDNEKPVGAQLFGSEESAFKEALKLEELEKFDIIDINMGCPAPKIFNNNEGSALLNDIGRASDIVKACVKAISKPITVKFRSGIDSEHIVAVEFARAMEKAGASAITIHARTKEQGYSGKADLEVAKAVKDAVKIPVIVSGDCVGYESYVDILNKTQADGVMIARGALGRPEIFKEILTGKPVKVNKLEDIKEHVFELLKYYSERYVVLNMRSHIAYYLKGRRVALDTRLKLLKSESVDEILNILKSIFNE